MKDNLQTYANIRGGRLRASSIVAKSRSAQLREADIQLYVVYYSAPSVCSCLLRPSLLAMIPTLIAGTVGYVVSSASTHFSPFSLNTISFSAGAHWVSPSNALGLSNPASHDPSRSTAELFAGKVQLHPDTDPHDPLYARFGLRPGHENEE